MSTGSFAFGSLILLVAERAFWVVSGTCELTTRLLQTETVATIVSAVQQQTRIVLANRRLSAPICRPHCPFHSVLTFGASRSAANSMPNPFNAPVITGPFTGYIVNTVLQRSRSASQGDRLAKLCSMVFPFVSRRY